jgi:uncharacterized protein YjbJ (UPF0337 family)
MTGLRGGGHLGHILQPHRAPPHPNQTEAVMAKQDDARDEIKGEATDIRGRVKRQVGEWSGDRGEQLEGMKEQAEGKAQKAAGRTKAKAEEITEDLKSKARRKRAA